MQYFRNYELANTHHVSQATVGKWVEAARQGRLDLTLHEHNGKSYIANTAKNAATIEKLVEERRKYRNSRGFKTITPRPEFYQLYNQGQIYDIVLNLERYHEIPREYNYFDGGADNWDNYAQRLASETTPNTLTSTIKLLKQNSAYIDDLVADCKFVNIVDLGVGNAFPAKDLLTYFLDSGRLRRYVAIDISKSMLDIASRNITDWFGDKVSFEGYELDFNRERFANILAEEYTIAEAKKTVNLILLFGGTLSNLRDPHMALKMINDSLSVNDFLLVAQKLDTERSRRYFDFSSEKNTGTLAPNHRFIFDLLNIDDSFYEVEMGYDEAQKQRYIRVRLKMALALRFSFEDGERTIELNRGSTILLWRAWQNNANDLMKLIDRSGFDWLHASQTADQEYILTVSRGKVH